MTMRILVIGGGAIASSLKEEARRNRNIEIESIGLREFQLKKSIDQEALLSHGYDRIIYLGFHKGILRNNLVAIRQVGSILRKQGFNGELIFISSHASIVGHLSSRTSLWERMSSYTRYFYIKRAQEWIVKRLGIYSRILYLPIVTGLPDNREAFFCKLKNTPSTDLPTGGYNRLYLLSAKAFASYLQKDALPREELSNGCQRVFLYSQYCSLNQYLAEKRIPCSDMEVDGFSGLSPSPSMLHRHILIQAFRELVLFLLELTSLKLPPEEAAESEKKINPKSEVRSKTLPTSRYIQFSIDLKSPPELAGNSKFLVVKL